MLRLEELAAATLGFPAALFVPTGTMGNQLAVHLQTRPGSEVIIEARGHIFNFEMGAMAVWSGALPAADRHRRRPARAGSGRGRDRPPGLLPHADPPACPREHPQPVVRAADGRRSHALPGGRGARPRARRAPRRRAHLQRRRRPRYHARPSWRRGCDTVMFCLSKGLAAPAGSMLCGSKDLIEEAIRARKLFGGGMRQIGVLAAAGIVALTEMVGPSRRGPRAARGASPRASPRSPPWTSTPRASTRTSWSSGCGPRRSPAPPRSRPSQRFVTGLKERGVLCGTFTATEVRMVTHYEITDADVEATLRAAREVLKF